MYSQRFPFECLSCAVFKVEKSRLLKSLMGFFSKGFHSPGKAGGKKTLSERWIELLLTFKMSFAQEKRRRKKLAFLYNLDQFVTNIHSFK